MNVVATYGRSVCVLAIGLFCGWWVLDWIGGLTAEEMVKYTAKE